MLDKTRLRNPRLFDKIVSPEEAATLIKDGMNVGPAVLRLPVILKKLPWRLPAR